MVNGIPGKVLPRSSWKVGKVKVLFETLPRSKVYSLRPQNLKIIQKNVIMD